MIGPRLARLPASISRPWLSKYLSRRHNVILQKRRLNGPSSPFPDPNPVPVDAASNDSPGSKGAWAGTAFKMAESALTTFASIAILGLVGYSYTLYYKRMVLEKMEEAFRPGDPVLDVAYGDSQAQPDDEENYWVLRPEQQEIDAIVAGLAQQHYYLLVGEKGTGKSSMLLSAMHKVDGEGIAMFEAHADLEIFRVRLGKALNFEYHEDNIGGLFSIRGPRDASALLDIERACNKLEKVALKRRKNKKGPLVLIMNNVHLVRDDEDGRDLLELIQQRAEQWAAANLITVVFNSDDYWVYERLKNYATRLKVLSIQDLPKDAAMAAVRSYRQKYYAEVTNSSTLEEVYNRVGGRLSYLNRVAKEEDMLKMCDHIETVEKTWLLNKIGILGTDMDDDVMDQQKFASAAFVLAKALVDQEISEEDTEELSDEDRKFGKQTVKRFDENGNHILPSLPIHLAREKMTRADFLQLYDQENLFTITAEGLVRADSIPMYNAMRNACKQPGFEEFLEDTLNRISAIESLGRTRELTIKDLWDGGKYRLQVLDKKSNVERVVEMQAVKPEDEDGDDSSKGQ